MLSIAISLPVGLLVICIVWKAWESTIQKHREDDFAAQQGCLPIKMILRGELPLSLDLVKGLWHANTSQHLLAFLQPFIDSMGPTLELRLLGNIGLVTIDPENVKSALSRSKLKAGELDFCFGNRCKALLPLFGEGIFTQDGIPWRHSRDMLRKQFTRIQYHNLEIFAAHVEQLVSRLAKSTDHVVDLRPLLLNFTLDTTTSLLFGESAGSLDESSQDELGASLKTASWYSAIRVQLAYLYWLCSPPQYFRACDRVREYADRWVKQALDEGVGRGEDAGQYEFIRNLYGELKDRRLVREQLVNVLLAGRDTTACLLSWTFRLLVRHESVLTRLRKEIDFVQGDDIKVTRANLQEMPYVKHVLDEVLRLYPPVPVNFREARHPTTLPRGGGPDGLSPILVRTKQGIGYAPYHMHRRKDLYGEDALCFRPERWEDGSLQERIGWGYLPFNGGPRICLGKEFALLEASYALVRIVQGFPELSLPADEEVVPIGDERQSITLTLAPADGCRVRLRTETIVL